MKSMKIEGSCDHAFKPVADAFLSNFNRRKEYGASVSVVIEGKHVVDLWAGSCDAGGKKPWQEDTIANIYSSTKAMTALCALKLVEEEKLSLDKPVNYYWPEFRGEGKDLITVRMLLTHRAGMVGIKKRLHKRSIYEWDYMTEKLAGHRPWWTPGEKHGYHAVTYGWLIGEVIQRVTGKSIGTYFKEEIAKPFGIDIQIGLNESEFSRTAFMKPKRIPSIHKDMLRFVWPVIKNPTGATSSAFCNPFSIVTGVNSRSWKRAEIPSANGHSNARGLAKFYGILANGGQAEGKQLLSKEMIALCSKEESVGLDKVLNIKTRFSLGFMLSQKRASASFGANSNNFGHSGAGGSIGFADPDATIGFGYVMNKMDTYILVDPRAKKMIDALYSCV